MNRKIIFTRLLFIFLITLFVGCSSSSDDNERRSTNPDELRIDLDDITPEEPTIDTSDLLFLPKDDGEGQHIAYPRLSTLAFYGHYLYTPSDYLDNAYEYPLIIFLHGWTLETFDSAINPEDLDAVLTHGPPSMIELGKWDPSYPFIVASPQLVDQYWTSNGIHTFIEYLTEYYRVNKNRIYLTGLSLGGGEAWHYIAEKSDESLVAAIVPIAASYFPTEADKYKNIPICAFHGANDATVNAFANGGSVEMVSTINQIKPRVRAKVTIFPNTGHDSWTKTYNSFGMGSEDKWYNKFEKSIYDWMLQYKKE